MGGLSNYLEIQIIELESCPGLGQTIEFQTGHLYSNNEGKQKQNIEHFKTINNTWEGVNGYQSREQN